MSFWREADSERELKLDFERRWPIEGGPRVAAMVISRDGGEGES